MEKFPQIPSPRRELEVFRPDRITEIAEEIARGAVSGLVEPIETTIEDKDDTDPYV